MPYVCVFPVWVPLRPPVDRFVRPSVWWSAFVRPFVWVAPPPHVGRFPFRFPATFILSHLSVVRRLCYGALAHLTQYNIGHGNIVKRPRRDWFSSYGLITQNGTNNAVLYSDIAEKLSLSSMFYDEPPK